MIPLRVVSDRNVYTRVRWLRRVSQGAFLLLFLYLLLQVNIAAVGSPEELPEIHAPVGFFLEIDPLIAIGSVISTHALYRNLLWAVALIIATMVMGRFFCGWVCPMGTINHLVASFKSGRLRGAKRLEQNRYRPYQRWKYGILAVLSGAAIFTSLQVGVLDPIALLTRTFSLALLPAYDILTQGSLSWVSAGDWGIAQPVANGVSAFGRAIAVRLNAVSFQGAVFASSIFFLALIANRFITRFWCRGVCPLGALLGVLSKPAIFGMEKHAHLCTDCNRCALNCQGGDDPKPGLKWRQSECHLCMNCVADCGESGLSFKFYPGREETFGRIDFGRRNTLIAAGAGLLSVPLLRSAAQPEQTIREDLVRPPGALPESDFLSRCVRCGECMNVCPNNALHPTLLQAGMEGIWSPVLIPRTGYCEPTCVLCSQACPTGAIDELTEAEKGWVPIQGVPEEDRHPLHIGTAFYDHGRCLPWAMAKECIVCEEWCPTTPKAIYFEETEITTREGEYLYLKRPHVDPVHCVGCGACTFACPIKGAPAIYITSAGETRNPANGILLESGRPRPRKIR